MRMHGREGNHQTATRAPGKLAGHRGLGCGSDCVFRLVSVDEPRPEISVEAPGVASEFRIWRVVSIGATVATAVSPEGFQAFCGAGRAYTGQESK